MQPPLTGREAIEVRRKWRHAQWQKKYPNGEWRVVRQLRRKLGSRNSSSVSDSSDYWVVVLIHIVSTDFNGYDRLTHEDSKQYPINTPRGYGDRPYYHRTGAIKHNEWKFKNPGDAFNKFNEIRSWIDDTMVI